MMRGSSRLMKLIILTFISILTIHLGIDAWSLKHPKRGIPCVPDDEGSWSIGLFKGPHPLNLTPFENWPTDNTSTYSITTPRTNPILTCASITDTPSNFVADPFIFPTKGTSQPLFIFYETKSNPSMRGEIGVATNTDTSFSTWKHLGIALKEPWHLSYPFVFEYQNNAYMIPEGAGSGSLRLYKATKFPLQWEFVKELIQRPLIDASLVQWNDRWYIFASDPSRSGHKKNGELQIFHADTPFGPFTPHFLNPVMSGSPKNGARMAGRIIKYKDHLYRFGQDCSGTYGKNIIAFRIENLSPDDFKQLQVRFYARRSKQNDGIVWNRVRRHHIDAVYNPIEKMWLAVMDGDQQQSNELSRPIVYRCCILGVVWCVVFVFWWYKRYVAKQRHYYMNTSSGNNNNNGSRNSIMNVYYYGIGNGHKRKSSIYEDEMI